MAEQTQAASSPAETPDVFQGQQVSMDEFSKYRADGTVPERFKPAEPADPAPADAPEKKVETEPDSDPDAEAQEQPHKVSPAEKRIKQLLAKQKELERQLASRQDAPSASSTAATHQRAPQNYQEWRATFKPSEFVAKYGEEHPDAQYEDAQAAMFEHLSGAEKHFRAIEERVAAEKQALESKVGEARAKYEDFDEIKENFLAKTISDKGAPLIPLNVLGIINDSEVMAHLLYTIGSDEAELAKFVDMAKSNPNKAIRYVTRVESLIAEELAKPKETPVRGEDGKFAPEKPKTSAPKPPEPVGGGSSRAFDVSDESLSPEDWMRKRNKQLGKA
jgi:hypothetical protein